MNRRQFMKAAMGAIFFDPLLLKKLRRYDMWDHLGDQLAIIIPELYRTNTCAIVRFL